VNNPKIFLATLSVFFFSFLLQGCNGHSPNTKEKKDSPHYWQAPNLDSLADGISKKQIQYGRDLVVNTAKYLGPNGTVMHISNGMNCQNCHLKAGTAVFGNNYGSVASLYPKFRARSGHLESIYRRINDCLERSLDGKPLDSTGKEMQSIIAYIQFLGSNVPKGKKAMGSGLKDLAFMDRAADSSKGRIAFMVKCQTCHKANGEGQLSPDNIGYTYPPLWGKNSFTDAAGLYRISNFAKYIRYNMPFGSDFQNTQLSDTDAWDIAAFVLSQPRPHINEPKDWPDISQKPIDLPFGPYADSFSQHQHQWGPFKPILATQKNRNSSIQKHL
jgi:thiosulfate dehydrogenase